MFTGLVEELGEVQSIAAGKSSVRLTVKAHTVLTDVKLGDSIAVNGACLTVVDFGASYFTVDVMPETVQRTVLAYLKTGDKVNLERTLRVGDRLGGHLVSGHIDGVGIIQKKDRNDNAIVYAIQTDAPILRYIVNKGSIAIDGISLTVVNTGEDWFSVSLIPHTAAMTTLGGKGVGAKVNLEVDVIGKYIEKLLGIDKGSQTEKKQGMGIDFLEKHGFLA